VVLESEGSGRAVTRHRRRDEYELARGAQVGAIEYYQYTPAIVHEVNERRDENEREWEGRREEEKRGTGAYVRVVCSGVRVRGGVCAGYRERSMRERACAGARECVRLDVGAVDAVRGASRLREDVA
jgi:hypothetical protein